MIELNIESLSHEGRGVAHLDGKTIFVEGALPGEVVLCTYTKKHRRFDEARITEVITASPHRVEPRCAHFSICGGCSLQHLHPDQQILLKQQTLLEQFQHFGNLQPETLLPPLHSEAWGYRHKGRLGVKYVEKKQRLLIGFHEKNGRYIADLSQCEVLDPRAGHLLEALKQLISETTAFRHIPQIEVAIDDSILSLTIRHLISLTEADRNAFKAFAQHHKIMLQLYPNPPSPVETLWPEGENKLLEYTLPKYDLRFKFHSSDFTQINPAVNQAMVSLAMELLSPQKTETVLDLFCGLGNFTLPLAQHCAQAIGVEGAAEMVKRAAENAHLNHLDNTEFYAANLADPKLDASWMHRKIDKILLDPPRTGAEEIIAHFSRWKAKSVVYISCNPATLARDAGILVHQHRYRLVKAGVIDMFPHTKHVESIALFVRES